mmetsp:Transcript_14289/g.12601  ORF Transcript_14289/g.12601 Transcript_14289/m.12601 type:complete len:84 (-) Transcript_14289:20-271(-)
MIQEEIVQYYKTEDQGDIKGSDISKRVDFKVIDQINKVNDYSDCKVFNTRRSSDISGNLLNNLYSKYVSYSSLSNRKKKLDLL